MSAERKRVEAGRLLAEPYRIFFPIGVLWALTGVGFWVPKALAVEPAFLDSSLAALNAVSTKLHVWIQLYGFLWAFVVGFLTTALPFFAGAKPVTAWELAILVPGALIPGAFALAQDFRSAHAAFIGFVVALALMMGGRALRGRRRLPPTFIFIPFGFLSAILGSAIHLAEASGAMVSPLLQALSYNLLVEGFILFLLLGVAGFLFPIIAGVQPPGAADRGAVKSDLWIHALSAAMIFVSFWIEIYGARWVAVWARAIIASCEGIGQIRAHWRPRAKSAVAVWLRASIGLLLLGLWAEALLPPQYRLAVRHVTLMGGFGLAAFGVATHAILSHGGYPGAERRWAVWLGITAWLMLLGLATRVAADWMGASALRHYGYAAGVWCLGLLVWAGAFLFKVGVQPVDDAHG